MSHKAPRIKVWLDEQLAKLAPRCRVLTERPACQRALAWWRVQWHENRRRTLIGGAMQSKASVVTLSMFDIRSGVQISISEGNSTATNFGAAMGAFGGGVGGGLGGFSRSPEGKATVAAFMDAYNNMVISLRNYKAQEVKGGLGRGGQLKVGK